MAHIARDKKKPINSDIPDMGTYFIKPMVGPNFDIECTKPEIDFSETEHENFTWFLSRYQVLASNVMTIDKSQTASLQVGQQYCIVTFDLAVAKKHIPCTATARLQTCHRKDGCVPNNIFSIWCTRKK